ncbi:DUF2062 domain-containing protein [Flammeovirgaceae bacterium KN852]|uniref:DUF2062 domain-containing protein n=2 Tax=Marinigracilibium pacificum TaxID=2729599 RepID=A0A848IX60_9BACT|nr:DUF2062 domain-containing protein [Marinigracilibium pacificum]NMM47881.1 DUF2062 domain-containing protein [Marinigracilibium pacificum]
MQLQSKFEKYNCCVVIPTYNNQKTLASVIDGVLEYTSNIIIVNDGATDNTPEILEKYSNLEIIRHEVNKGKGRALQNAFSKARESGFTHVITIDSDGQHFPEDLELFLDEIDKNENALVIGARNMQQENVPGKSSFGNKFSNFWFRVDTGITLSDTQSGYRLYPVKAMEGISFYTNRFEFEVEVLVKSAWKGIEVKNIPIQVHYEPGKERISHFRPFQDFTRISILNTYLFILAVLFYIPLRFFRSLTKENIKKFLNENFFNNEEPVHIKALSVGFGVFMGIFPIWGYQLLVGIPLAHYFRLNKAMFVLAAHISIPPMIPVIIYFSYRLGYYLVPNPTMDLFFSQGITFEQVKDNLIQYLSGAVAFSIAAGLVFGVASYFYFLIARNTRLKKSQDTV